MGNVKKRLTDLEKDNGDQIDQIRVVWESDKDKPRLEPGDVRVWLDKSGEVQREVVKDDKKG